MGASQSLCGENLITKLYEEYGMDKVLEFITKEKSKLIIEEQFTLLTRKFHESFLEFESTLKQIIESKIKEITIKFEQLKNKTNSLLPGGVAVLERVKGKSVNEFSGFNNVLNQIQLIKEESLNNLELKKYQMIEQIEEEKQLMITNLNRTQPSIPLYKEIPEPIKRMLFIEMEKTYEERFINNKSGLEEKIMGLFNASALYRMFQEMSPVGVIEKIIVGGFGGMERNLLKSVLG